MVPMVAMKLTEIGELDEKDLMMLGAVNTSTNVFYSVTGFVQRKDKITYDSCDYLVRHVFKLPIGETVAEWALLKRIA